MPGADPAAVADLRERLVAMRDALVEGLAEADFLDGGRLRLLGDVAGALRALDDAAPAGDGGEALACIPVEGKVS